MPTPALDLPSAGMRPPVAALRLGYAGLLPFALGAALVFAVPDDEARAFAAQALSAYAALIVSFLGGIHWGIGFAAGRAAPAGLFVWGVVPSLVAWPALLMPPGSGLVLHGVMLLVCYAVDRRVYPRHGLGGWLTLRFRLSGVAALACFLGAAGAA